MFEPRVYRTGFLPYSSEMLEGGAQESRPRRGSKRGKQGDTVLAKAAAESSSRLDSAPLATSGGGTLGVLMRPWTTYGVQLQARTIVEDAGAVLWEGGSKTTPEIKRELVDLIDQTDSLVAVLDIKAAERPEDPRWWPSLRTVLEWIDEDPYFAKVIDQWSHARQLRILERVIHDLNADPSRQKLTREEITLLKERVKFASTTLPRIVNRGLRDKVDVETTTNHLHLHANLSDEALRDRIEQLRRNPQVRELLVVGGPLDEGDVIEGTPIRPPMSLPAAPMPSVEVGDLLGGGGE